MTATSGDFAQPANRAWRDRPVARGAAASGRSGVAQPAREQREQPLPGALGRRLVVAVALREGEAVQVPC